MGINFFCNEIMLFMLSQGSYSTTAINKIPIKLSSKLPLHITLEEKWRQYPAIQTTVPYQQQPPVSKAITGSFTRALLEKQTDGALSS